MFAINRTSRLLVSSVLALAALAGCRDRLLPTGVEPGGALFTQLSSGPVVNSLADPGTGTCDDTECTLREAIAFAAAGATITFAPALTGTITLTSDYLYIDKNLTITGPGAASLRVSGNNAYLVLWVGGSAAVISGLTITGGNNLYSGGGIFNSDLAGSLTLSHCVITGNTATGSGGGIYNGGTLTLTNSIVSGNTGSYGGGILNGPGASVMLTNTTVSGNTATGSSGGGIRNNTGGTVTLSNSTVSGNTAVDDGGGIYNYQGTATLTNSTVSGNTSSVRAGGVNNYQGTLTLVNSTVTGNTADYTYSTGGGISNQGTLTLTNSLLAGNQAANHPDLANDNYNPEVVLNSSYSLIGSASGHTITNGVNGNIVGVTTTALNLGALADNGGPTWTHALLTDSPAIDAGTNTGCPATDQRGTTRPQGTTCDIGAFEKEAGSGLPSPNFAFDLATLPAKTYGAGSFSVDAYATSTNSTGTKTFAVGTGSVGCSVTSAGMVTIIGAATDASYCILQASLASDGTYSAAGPISQSFHIAKAPMTVTAQNATITYGASTPSFGEVYNGFLNDDGLSSLGGTLIRTFAGVSPSYGPSTTAPTDAGTYSITLSGHSSNNYSFTYVGGTYTINKAAGSVSIANLPTSATVGGNFTPTYTKVGDGTASVSSSTPGVCSVNAGVVSFDAAGTCTLQASLTVGTNHLPATGIDESFTIGSGSVSFSSSCTYTTNRKGDLVVSVSWQNADPGVTLIGMSVGGTTLTKQTGPRATGEWARRLPGSAVPTYELKGGTGRNDASTTLVAAGTACTQVP